MDTVINVESDSEDEVQRSEEENEENPTSEEKHPPKKKIYTSALPGLAVVVTIFLIFGGIVIRIYLVVIKHNKPKEPPIFPDVDLNTTGIIDTAKSSPPDGTTTTSAYKRPTLITTLPPPPTCYQRQNYSFLSDMDVPGTTKKIGLFTGKVTHERMFSICDRINVESRRNPDIPNDFKYWKGAIFFNNKSEEDIFDKIIESQKAVIFPGKEKLLWTGVAYYFDTWSSSLGRWEAKYPNDYRKEISDEERKYRNFCDLNSNSLEAKLVEKGESFGKTDLHKRIGGKIYVVKNYERPNNCWELYTTKELTKAMSQPEGTIPRLPFACLFKVEGGTFSGSDSIPGNFKRKKELTAKNGIKYSIYKVSATLEDAKKECESHDSKLIQFKDVEEWFNFTEVVKHEKAYFDSDLFWTGAYLDASNGKKKDLIISPTFNHTIVPHAKDWKRMSRDLVNAAKNLIASIKVNKAPRDCGAKDHVYVGMSFPESTHVEGLMVFKALNAKGQMDLDSFRAYVACQKN